MYVANKANRTYIVAAKEPSYYKIVNLGKRGVAYKSNPDISIVRTQDATAHFNTKYWGPNSDHRSVTFTIKSRLQLK